MTTFREHKFTPPAQPELITITRERYDAVLAEARREGADEERHKCLADMCWMCGKNYPVHKVVVGEKTIWMHPRGLGNRYGIPCQANPTRLRWMDEEKITS